MIEKTLMIVGPAGIGKSPLDEMVRSDAVRIDPYRLRPEGPRPPEKNSGVPDRLYARPRLRDELYLALARAGMEPTCLTEDVHWFSQAMLLSFWVRNSWQLLFLEGLDARIAKAEIFAPAVPSLLMIPQIRRVFGHLSIVILHPARTKLEEMQTWELIERETRSNCRQREGLSADPQYHDEQHDSKELKTRVESIKQEAPVWLKMLKYGATEYESWEYAEYKYPKADTNRQERNKMLLAAKGVLVARNESLSDFFLQDDEILRLK